MPFSQDSISIDPAAETGHIVARLQEILRDPLRRRGFVLGLSGGIDSSVCAALAVRAAGAGRVFAILMPERDSDPESRRLGAEVAETFGIEYLVEDIGPALDALKCYARRDALIRQVVPDYGAGWRSKIVIADATAGAGYGLSYLVVQDPDGATSRHRLPPQVYLGIVAATNMKQRIRKQFEYHHADRLNYAVMGTPNLLEHELGFFVKNGDGSADVKPIAHLYKSQVYQLAEYLGVPEDVRRRMPTTDTYSLPQSQEEFYFALPYREMDLNLYAFDNGVAAAETAAVTGLSETQVEAVRRDIAAKRKAARYLHAPAQMI